MMVELIKRIVLFIFLSGIIFINIACSHNLAFNKNNLKQAEVNKYYEDLIKIEDSEMPCLLWHQRSVTDHV